MTNEKRINVVTTAYEGDVAFPEADHYPEYVAEQLSQLYGVKAACSVGGTTRVDLYGYDDEGMPMTDLVHEISTLVKVDLWNDFCDDGYKAYSAAAPSTITA